MDSIWKNDVKMPQFLPLEGDLTTDVLVVGGGLAGLLCAWNVSRAGADCVLIEQNRLMGGVSGRTTAKLTAQHGLIYHKLMKKYGPDTARLYWQANQDALENIWNWPGKRILTFRPGTVICTPREIRKS